MLDLHASKSHVLRAVLLPLECPRKQLKELLALSVDSEENFDQRLDEYTVQALKPTGGSEEPPVVKSLHEIATFSALSALRVEFADPLRGTEYYERYPEYSSERRMMTRPLQNHPGLSLFGQYIRDQYVCDVLYTFLELTPDWLQRETVAALLAPDTEYSSSARPARTYYLENESLEELHSRYASRVMTCQEGFQVSLEHLTARTLIEPVHDHLYFPSRDFNEIQPLVLQNEDLFVPTEVVLAKLANYAYHGWYRIVNLAYNLLSEEDKTSYINGTPEVRETLQQYLNFSPPDRSFNPYYGAVSENPLVEQNTNVSTTYPDKRLTTVADTIRWSRNLDFDNPVRLEQLFTQVCRFFPSPDRPSNDIMDKQTLENALDNAIDTRFTSVEADTGYTVPAPSLAPFFPRMRMSPWSQYRRQLAELTRKTVESPASSSVSPYLPESVQPRLSTEYVASLQHADRAAASEMRYSATQVNTVRLLVDPADVGGLSVAECLFLTRIGLAMERRIRLFSLTQSMASFRDGPNGSTLNVDVEELEKRGYLSQHSTPQTYYSVPWKVREQLGIPNISHDGWGERSPSETTLHRVGVDLVAVLVASRPDVDRVVRYCDAWRLQPAEWWDDISHLSEKRLDIVGFSDGEPVVVAEVETETGDTDGTQGTVSKLDAFPQQVDRYLVAPSGRHLSAIMQRLSGIEQFNVEIPRRKNDGYRPKEVRTQLAEQGAIDSVLDELFTYRNVRKRLPKQAKQSECTDCIVGAI